MATGGAGLLALAALWRATLAIRHYQMAQAIQNDPSGRELEQVAALFELGSTVVLLAHAVVVGYFAYHPVRMRGAVFGWIGVLVSFGVFGSAQPISILALPFVSSSVFLLGGAAAGYRSDAPWLSAYVGALVGGVVGAALSPTRDELWAVVALVVPAALWILVGVALGRVVRGRAPGGRAA